jgi:anti-sigma factor RsiW
MATREELLRLHDGELEPAEAERLRARLTPEDRTRLAALEEVSLAVREHARARAEAQPLDVWAAIGTRLEERPGAVVPLRRRRLWVGAGVATAVALAAALVLLFWPRGGFPIGSTVESVEFGDEAGLLFQVPDTHTTVIWQTTKEETHE